MENDLYYIQKLYEVSDEHVRGKGFTEETAVEYYRDYLEFIRREQPPPARVLDIGCGNAWSTWVLANAGYECVGVDLNVQAFEATPHPNMELRDGNIMSLPFAAESFDIVACYQVLEHVPEPERALEEMLRVAKPQGMVAVIGPNLLGIMGNFRVLFANVWRNRPLKTIFFRSITMPRHPFGNTVPEAIVSLATSCWYITDKLVLSRKPKFTMRIPDTKPPFNADNDACYVCNPIDLLKFFRKNDCRITRNGKHGRPPLTWLLPTGTYVAARKSRS